MTPKQNAVLVAIIFLAVLYLGSAFMLVTRSHDFVLAKRERTLTQLPVGTVIDFADRSDHAGTLLGGWSSPEQWGVWVDGRRSELALKLPDEATILSFDGRFFLPEGSQRITVAMDGHRVASVAVSGAAGAVTPCRWSLTLPKSARELSVLAFSVEDAASPAQLGLFADGRHLGFGLSTMTVGAVASEASCDAGSISVTEG